MKDASTGFVEALNQPIRPTTQCRVVIGEPLSELLSEGDVGRANFATSIAGKSAEYQYITLEKDFFKVGSNQIIVPTSSGYKNNGFVSNTMATKSTQTSGQYEFVTIPSITVNLKASVNIGKLSLTFTDGTPAHITIKATSFGITTYSQSFDVSSTEVSYTLNAVANVLTVTFDSMWGNTRRLRVSSMQVDGYEFTNDDIISLEHSMNVDPLSLDLPSNYLKVEISNYDHLYDPDNSEGVWDIFSEKQKVKVYYGTEVNGATEWLAPDILYLANPPTVESGVATFEAYDLLYFLKDTYIEGEYSEGTITIKKVIREILITNCGLSTSDFDLGTSGFISAGLYAPMSLSSYKECLQLLANASCTTLLIGRDGVIRFLNKDFDEAANVNLVDYNLDYDKMMEKPVVKVGSQLKDVEITTHVWSRRQNVKEEVIAYEGESKTITESTVVNATYTTSPIIPVETTVSPDSSKDVELDYAWTYARAATVIVKPSASSGVMQVKITGYQLYDMNDTYTLKVNDSGETCKVDNPMIGGDNRKVHLANRIKSWYRHRYTYEVDFRQDFRLELMDKIQMQTQFNTKVPAIITGLTFRLPGQTGTINLRRMD